MTRNDATAKLENYCAYQERCEQEVRDKMAKLTVPTEWHAEIFEYLREQGFLDDARFAKTYAGSKLRLKNGYTENKVHRVAFKRSKVKEEFVLT